MKQPTERPDTSASSPHLQARTDGDPSRPDAETHARMLLESRSRREALLIAQTNASIGRSSEYWSQVLLAVFRAAYSVDE